MIFPGGAGILGDFLKKGRSDHPSHGMGCTERQSFLRWKVIRLPLEKSLQMLSKSGKSSSEGTDWVRKSSLKQLNSGSFFAGTPGFMRLALLLLFGGETEEFCNFFRIRMVEFSFLWYDRRLQKQKHSTIVKEQRNSKSSESVGAVTNASKWKFYAGGCV